MVAYGSAPAQQRAVVRQCAAVFSSARGCVQQYAWQRVTVCSSAHGSRVCTQCARQCAAVRLVVCDSAQQGVCGSAAVRLIRCMTVRQCVCGGVAVCGRAAVCGAWQWVTVRTAESGSAHGRMQCMRQCASVRLVVYGSASDSVRLSSSAAV